MYLKRIVRSPLSFIPQHRVSLKASIVIHGLADISEQSLTLAFNAIPEIILKIK